ncbi:copper chaperone PCu(A)C [Teichococcus aestuarii]|uniref:Copper chaperone PCu(A)C n=1 Tax=Teichococcus aestuarii TaxID=568898 RepID=A0A2U1UYV6_9PROT|nr:copper chaperone PCu(A)C [Pseudoroseomonas aestuarii]PWC26839.1 hypothetical protein CR165_20945 [Pseudoroseomonas aestuarii]
MKRRVLLATAALTLAGRGNAQPSSMLVAERAWSRPALARIGTAVTYLTLRNDGSAPVRVVGGSTDIAETVEIHESVVDNNVARMRPRPEGVAVPSGGSVRFQPNGLHLMLMKPRADLRAGQIFTITLRLDNGATLDVPVTVAAREPAAGHDGMHH